VTDEPLLPPEAVALLGVRSIVRRGAGASTTRRPESGAVPVDDDDDDEEEAAEAAATAVDETCSSGSELTDLYGRSALEAKACSAEPEEPDEVSSAAAAAAG